MAVSFDSAVRATEHAGVFQTVVRVFIAPSLTPIGNVLRTVDLAGRTAGRWIHPLSVTLLSPGTLQTFFGMGNPITHIRFGNPNGDYHVFAPRGQLRGFIWPVPYRNTPSIPTKPLNPAAMLWTFTP